MRDALRLTEHPWLFRLPAAVLTAGFATAGAALPQDAPLALRVLAAALASVGGAALIGALAFVVVLCLTPLRQRDEARAQLTPPSSPDVRSLSEELDAFVLARLAEAPGDSMHTLMRTMGMSRTDRSRVTHESNAAVRKARAEALGGYHDQFRSGVLEVLERPGRQTWRILHEQAARDPQSINDIETIAAVISHIADTPQPGAATGADEEAASVAAQLREDANGLASWSAERLAGRPPDGPSDQSPDALERAERAQTAYDRRTDANYYSHWHQPLLAVAGHAIALGAADGSARRVIAAPHGDYDAVAKRLRDLAADLAAGSESASD